MNKKEKINKILKRIFGVFCLIISLWFLISFIIGCSNYRDNKTLALHAESDPLTYEVGLTDENITYGYGSFTNNFMHKEGIKNVEVIYQLNNDFIYITGLKIGYYVQYFYYNNQHTLLFGNQYMNETRTLDFSTIGLTPIVIDNLHLDNIFIRYGNLNGVNENQYFINSTFDIQIMYNYGSYERFSSITSHDAYSTGTSSQVAMFSYNVAVNNDIGQLCITYNDLKGLLIHANYDSGYSIGLSEGLNIGFNNGVSAVVSSPNNYDLKTLVQYNNYGEEQKQLGKDEGYTNGIHYVLDNLDDYDLKTLEEYNDYGSSKYTEGYQTAEDEITPDLATNGFRTLMGSILNAPYNILHGILNFEIFGINLFNLFTFIFSLILGLAVLRFIF